MCLETSGRGEEAVTQEKKKVYALTGGEQSAKLKTAE